MTNSATATRAAFGHDTAPGGNSLIRTEVDFDREGLQKGYLRLPHSHDRSAYGHIPIPVWVAKRGEGPTVLLTGGVHGDEYEGPAAIAQMMRELSLDQLAGRVVAIPALNFPAYLAGARLSPIDTLNLNRCFPGDRDGSPTQMIAHYVETVLMPLADYCFDFHAGGASLNYLPTLIIDGSEPLARQAALTPLIAAFRPPRLLQMDMLGEDRLIAAAAKRHGVAFLTGEFGGGSTINPDSVDMLRDGIRRMLRAIGILTRAGSTSEVAPLPHTRTLSVKGAADYVFAPRSGIFEPRFRLGDEIEANQLAGYIHDPHAPWRLPEEVRFSGRGLALCIRTYALVSAGDCLAHLASDVDDASFRENAV
jgi:predicted deacylase